jgi:hypothetical protein
MSLHADPLLSNDHGMSSDTTAVAAREQQQKNGVSSACYAETLWAGQVTS